MWLGTTAFALDVSPMTSRLFRRSLAVRPGLSSQRIIPLCDGEPQIEMAGPLQFQ
jgi:hypothetical protein